MNSPLIDLPLSVLRVAVSTGAPAEECACVQALLTRARQSPEAETAAQRMAHHLASTVRETRLREGGLDALMHQFPLNSAEGLALMGLAEALLRIPDAATSNRLLRDQLSKGHWRRDDASVAPWIKLATRGMATAAMLTAPPVHAVTASFWNAWREAGQRLIAKATQPFAALAADVALRALGQRFVLGQTIEDALTRSSERRAQGYRFSYDMLGEAALTAQDALRYSAAYEHAIHAVGKVGAAQAQLDLIDRPSVSVKLSALHPRFERAQRARVLAELVPRLGALFKLAQGFGIGLTVDAEEAHRLELTLDVMEAIAREPSLAGYGGIGFVVQAYNKRAPYVIDWITALARETGQRFMVRLVKGAYWDSEIKRAQVEGHAHYPVYTRKVFTDTAYLACARQLLDAGSSLYPQFATHHPHTLAALYTMGRNKRYEYQCLHGMGESLYDQVIGHAPGAGLNDEFGDDFEEDQSHTCRIYAPVGPHDTLLAYLVRRLLENSANSSFVNRILEPSTPITALVADPVAQAAQHCAAPEESVATLLLPTSLYGDARRNSCGIDFADEAALSSLAAALDESRASTRVCLPLVAGQALSGPHRVLRNPARHAEAVGIVIDTPLEAVRSAVERAVAAASRWAETPLEQRAVCLERAADLLQTRQKQFFALAVREAGKTWAHAVAEVREAIDFLRYYAAQACAVLQGADVQPRGALVAISPWNFPLAIFIGQVSAALVAGNTVLAKPAEQTPLIAAAAVQLLHEAGIPGDVLQLLPGAGEGVGAALVADTRVAGVLFTGSLAVAQQIAQTLAQRDDQPLLIAETGGVNAMIVDSSALPEQVVTDVIASAFGSAGQRCSALRLMCVQEDIAGRVMDLLKGAMDELVVGDPADLATDVGPVIDSDAQAHLLHAIEALKSSARSWHQSRITARLDQGTFVAPTVAEVERVQNVRDEIFGPVLHVVRFGADELDSIIDAINANGYGLTQGVHSRINATVERVCQRVHAGNIYVNRNMVGAVVGVQPFGGEGMSGTGPKAGGPMYLRALVRKGAAPLFSPSPSRGGLGWGWASHSSQSPLTHPHPHPNPPLEGEGVNTADAIHPGVTQRLIDAPLPALDTAARAKLTEHLVHYRAHTPLHRRLELPGPTGERNTLWFAPRGWVACLAPTLDALTLQCAAALACGNRVVLASDSDAARALAAVLTDVAVLHPDPAAHPLLNAVLFEGTPERARASRQQLAQRAGALVPLIAVDTSAPIDLHRLVVERCVCTNTTAWGGNAALMSRAE